MNRRQTAGHVLPLLAVCLGVLMGFGGVAVDVGFFEYKQQAQQIATDAAALGGAEQLAHANCSSAGETAAEAIARSDAGTNGYANGTNSVTVTANSPPTAGPYANASCAISVEIDNPKTQTFFTRLFGKQSMEETTSAVAASTPTTNVNPCIYLLSPTTNQNFNSGDVQAPQCSILINDSANFNGSTINAAAIGEANYAGSNNGGTFSSATPAPMLPVADPCPAIDGCNYLANNPPSTSNCISSYNAHGQTLTLPPGCYDNLNLNSANVTLNGLYIFNGGTNFNGATITGTNTTIYVTATGTPPNFNGDDVSLSPPTSGNMQGVLYYQVPSNTQGANFNGTTNYYSGLIYSPTATVNFNGSGGGYVVLVFGAINWNGSGAKEFATPPPGQALVNKAVIVQ